MQRTVEPTVEPVTLEEAKLHLRVDSPDDDALILDIISTARDYAEYMYGLAFLTQTWVLALDRWPRMDRVEQWPWPGIPLGSILLPKTPVQSVSSITWTGADLLTNTVATSVYEVGGNYRNPTRVALKPGQSWPSLDLDSIHAVQVTFIAGATTAAKVPRRFKQALLLLIGHWYQNRENTVIDSTRMTKVDVPLAADALLSTALPQMVG